MSTPKSGFKFDGGFPIITKKIIPRQLVDEIECLLKKLQKQPCLCQSRRNMTNQACTKEAMCPWGPMMEGLLAFLREYYTSQET